MRSNPPFQGPSLGQVFKGGRMLTVSQTLIFLLQLKDILFTVGGQDYCCCTCGISLVHLSLNMYINLLADDENYILGNFSFFFHK